MNRCATIFLLVSFNVVCQGNEDIVKVLVPEVKAKAGEEAIVKISVAVKNGFHIQANKVKDELIIPTTLEIEGGKEFNIKEQVFPAAEKFTLTGTDQYLEVYDGEFKIETSLQLSDRIQKGPYQLMGKLKYQACDSVRCLFPRTVEFLVNVYVH